MRTIILLLLSISTLNAQQKAASITPDKTVVYKQTDTTPLELHVFYPADFQKEDKRPGIVFFFGGGWSGGSSGGRCGGRG